MADWTIIRLNLRYHWKTVLLWGVGIGGMLVLVCWLLVTQANAWVNGNQRFPDGEVMVVVHRFCRGTFSSRCIEINGQPYEATYGTERLDTVPVCGDTDNGFGLLFNWNNLGGKVEGCEGTWTATKQ